MELSNNQIYIKKLSPTVQLPTKGTISSAGWDLYAHIEDNIYIFAHETKMIPTGIAVEIPFGFFGGIYARSGLATREGLRPANCTGVIDSDYRGEIIVALHNDGETTRCIEPGDRIAQLIVQPYLNFCFVEKESLDETARGNGGFGSTGTK